MAAIDTGSTDLPRQAWFRNAWFSAPTLGLLVGLMAWVAIAFSRQIGGIASIWPVNAVVLVWVLRSRPQIWPALVTAAFVGNVAAGLVWGGGWQAPFGLAASNALEITLGAAILRCIVGPGIDLSRRRDLVAFGAVALVGPAASAAVSSGLLALLSGSNLSHNFTVWFLADALGLVIVAPALLAARRGEIKALLSPRARLRTLSLFAVQLAAIVAICLTDAMGLKSLIFAAFMIPAFGLGVSGAAIGVLLGAAVVLGFAVGGPQFADLGGAELQRQVTILQLFLATTAAMALVIATTLEERRRLRVSLATTARDFQMLADNASDMVMRSDLAGRFVYISPALSRISGYEPEELIGRTAVSLVFPEDIPALVEACEQQIRTGGAAPPARVRYRCSHKDGRTIWFEAQPTLLTDPDSGKAIGFSDIVRDITDRKIAEAAVADSELRYRQLAEHTTDLVIRYDTSGVIEYASPSVRHLGYRPEEIVGRNMADFTHPDDQTASHSRRQTLSRGQTIPADETRKTRARRADGEWVWLEGTGVPVRDASGNVAAVVTILRDITGRMALEAAVAASERRYRLLADNAIDIILQYDLAGIVQYVSPSCREIGYAPEDLIGRPVADFCHPEDLAKIGQRMIDIANDAPSVRHDRMQTRVRCADGAWRWLEGQPSILRDENGAPIGAVSLMRDVTERLEMEEALRRKQAEAEAAAVAKTEFLANMSHEIRTPLTGIIGFAGLLEEQNDLSPTAAKFANRIATASQTLLSVVNDVLDFSKIEAGQVELDPQPFDPAAFVAETLDLVEGQALANGLELRTEIRGVLPEAILADSSRVRQVLLNLLGNAIKFTSQGSVSVGVSYLETGGGALRIAVTDTGVGIPKDRLDRLFQRFSQVDGSISRTYGGSGLGLAICKSLAEMMGGEIGVESSEGAGSTFWFTIAAPVVDRSTAPFALDDDAWECAPARILIVDDVPVNRELVGAMLGSFGHELSEASSGLEAVDAAMHQAFDLILMDLQMPGMDGMAATRAIRETCELNRATPIVALSANVMAVHLDGCRAAGMNDHIAKPIDAVELLTKVAKWTELVQQEIRMEGRR